METNNKQKASGVTLSGGWKIWKIISIILLLWFPAFYIVSMIPAPVYIVSGLGDFTLIYAVFVTFWIAVALLGSLIRVVKTKVPVINKIVIWVWVILLIASLFSTWLKLDHYPENIRGENPAILDLFWFIFSVIILTNSAIIIYSDKISQNTVINWSSVFYTAVKTLIITIILTFCIKTGANLFLDYSQNQHKKLWAKCETLLGNLPDNGVVTDGNNSGQYVSIYSSEFDYCTNHKGTLQGYSGPLWQNLIITK